MSDNTDEVMDGLLALSLAIQERVKTEELQFFLTALSDAYVPNCTHCKEASNDLRTCQQDWPGLRNTAGQRLLPPQELRGLKVKDSLKMAL